MRICDVAIVGSGPAGSAAALALRHAAPHAHVLLLEAREHPRIKACGGAMSPRGLRILHALGVPLSVPHREVEGAILTGATGERFLVRQSMGVVVRRPELDAMLAGAARAAGAELIERCRVRALDSREDGVVLHTTRGPVRAAWVVGADGSAGVTAPWVDPFVRKPIRAVEAITRPRTDDDPRYLHFDFSLNPDGLRGYAWDFPCAESGELSFNRGVYATDQSTRGPKPLSVMRDGAHRLEAFIVRGYEKQRQLARGRVVLAGDAVGANLLTGEGISPALEGAVFAGRFLAGALSDKRVDARDYTRAFKQTTLARRLWWWTGIAKRLYGEHGDWWTDVAMQDHDFHRLMAADYAGAIDAPDVRPRFIAYLVRDVARHWVA